MKIIRKRLSEDEVTPASLRWNESIDLVQQSPDGGETWVDTPQLDPRHGDGFRKPPLTGTDARCDAAARECAAWRNVYDIFISSTDAAQFAVIILNILLLLAGGVGVLISLILLVFDALIAIGKSNMEAAFSDAVWDDIMCIIYNNIGQDGEVSEAELSAIYADIQGAYPGVVYNTLIEIGHLFGEVLLSNAAVERSETGDCIDCVSCFPIVDFSSPYCSSFFAVNGASLGTIDESFGDPAPSAKSGRKNDFQQNTYIGITIPVNEVLSSATLRLYHDLRSTNGQSFNIVALYFNMRGDSNQVIASSGGVRNQARNTWATYTLNYAGSLNCANIEIVAGLASGSDPSDQVLGNVWIDTVTMTPAP